MEDPSEGGPVFTGPVGSHASSIFISPAALGFAGRGVHLYFGSALRLDSVDIDRKTIDPASSVVPAASVSSNTLTPGGMLALYGTVLGERAVVGLALHTPFTERFIADQDALRYHVLDGYHYQALLSAAGAFRFTDWFTFGLGVSLGYTWLRLQNARDTALDGGSDSVTGIASDCGGAPCGFENPQASELNTLNATTGGLGGLFEAANIGVALGIAVQVRRNWWTTLSYVSPPGALFETELDGRAAVIDAPRDGGGRHSGRAQVTYRLPQSIWLGLRGPVLPGYDLVTSARWQNLSRHSEFDIRRFGNNLEAAAVPEWAPHYRGMRDVVRLQGGLEQQEGPTLRIGGRLHIESPAVGKEEISPLQVASLNAGVSVGAELRLSDHWVMQSGYGFTWYLPQDVDPSGFDPRDRVACVDSGYDFGSCDAVRDGRAIPTAAGDYRHLRHAFTLSLRYDSL